MGGGCVVKVVDGVEVYQGSWQLWAETHYVSRNITTNAYYEKWLANKVGMDMNTQWNKFQ